MKINVCLSTDSNYAKYAGVVIASILSNKNPDDDLQIFILENGVTQKDRENILSLKSIAACEIKFVSIDDSLFKDFEKVKTHDYISIASYYIFKMASLIPEAEKIIYLDCDVVVNSSLSVLFAEDMEDALIGGVKDIGSGKMNRKLGFDNSLPHINAGMIMMNLKQWREENTEKKFSDYVVNHFEDIFCGDQQIFNFVCHGRIKFYEDKWNVQVSNLLNRSSYMKNPNVIHYVSRQKPWNFGSFNIFKSYYFKYLQLTPWALKEEEKFHWHVTNKIVSALRYIKYRPFFLFDYRLYKVMFLAVIS